MIEKSQMKYGVVYVVRPAVRRRLFRDSYSGLVREIAGEAKHCGFIVEEIKEKDAQGVVLTARRFNVGNAFTDAVVTLALPAVADFDPRDLDLFLEAAADVTSLDRGDKIIPLRQYGYFEDYDIMPAPRARRASDRRIEEPDTVLHADCWGGPAALPSIAPGAADESMEFQMKPCAEAMEDDDEVFTLEMQRRHDLEDIEAKILEYVTRYQADPSQLMQELLKGKIVIEPGDKLSPLVVNNDMKIILPNYNEVEIKMPAMCRTLYILFLLHPEGIELRSIGDHRKELDHIYSVVMPGRDESRGNATLENLVNPLSNTLNEYISKIKRCFSAKILNDDIAAHYHIAGKRGDKYRIALPPEKVTLPRALRC